MLESDPVTYLSLRLLTPNEVNREVQMNRSVLELRFGLSHHDLDLLLAPTKNSSKELGCVRLNRLRRLHKLALANLLERWVLGPRADRNLHQMVSG